MHASLVRLLILSLGTNIQLLPPESPFRRHSEDMARSFQRFKTSLSAPSTPRLPPPSAFPRLTDDNTGTGNTDENDNNDNGNTDNPDSFDNDDTTFVYDALPPRLQAQWSIWKEHLESLPTLTALLQRTLEEAKSKVG